MSSDDSKVTGCINASTLDRINPDDAGGQYDSSGGDGGLGNPRNSVCTGCVSLTVSLFQFTIFWELTSSGRYNHYVELLEPRGPRVVLGGALIRRIALSLWLSLSSEILLKGWIEANSMWFLDTSGCPARELLQLRLSNGLWRLWKWTSSLFCIGPFIPLASLPLWTLLF